MKKIILSMLVILFATVSLVYAQKDVTQFLGIPVDGYKPEMIKKLKEKGYTISPSNKDVLVGEFNGMDVNIHIATNNNKVCRIMVCDVNPISEGDIKIRFNNLCQQFKNNGKYTLLSDYTIPEDEDISYSMSVENKRYEAVFYQHQAEEILEVLLTKYTEEQISNPTEEEQRDMIEYLSDMLARHSKKLVWFKINELYGKYYITIFYDNEYNRANGEDL